MLDNLVTRLINQLWVAADGGSYSNELILKELKQDKCNPANFYSFANSSDFCLKYTEMEVMLEVI